MKAYDAGRMFPRVCPEVEAILAHERSIVPQVAIVRARALARARDALKAGDVVSLDTRSLPARGRLLGFAAAAVVALLATGAAAFQLLRSQALTQSPATRWPYLLQYAESALPRVVTEKASAAAAKSTPVRTAPAAAPTSAQAPGTNRQASLPARDDNVLEELRLLELAQRSAAHGDHAAVLVATTEHERRYPAGRLCEEREALRLRALIGLGRGHEARQVAARFRRDFPRSVLLPKLDDMLIVAQ